MSLEYIRQNYKVPAKRGMQVMLNTENHAIWGKPRLVQGTITGSCSAKLKVRDNERKGFVYIVHPTDENLTYLSEPTD